MRIVFVDEASIILEDDIDFSGLQQLGDYQTYPNSNEQQIIDRCAAAQVIVTNKAVVTAKAIAALDRLQLVAVTATGYNNVDLDAARERNVIVSNVAGYAEDTVPQHAFALMLNLATKAYLYAQDVQRGDWAKSDSFTLLRYPTFELRGLTIGIIGFGTIGRGVARIAEGFGMQVLAHDAFPIKGSSYSNTELDQLLRQSDVITVHSPLTEQTRNLIDAAALAKMKRSAFVINTARGGIVDEQALADALNAGRIAGAGFDVLTEEPPAGGNPLLDAKNIIITPHSAWSTKQARQKLIDESAVNVKAFIDGTPRNVVT